MYNKFIITFENGLYAIRYNGEKQHQLKRLEAYNVEFDNNARNKRWRIFAYTWTPVFKKLKDTEIEYEVFYDTENKKFKIKDKDIIIHNARRVRLYNNKIFILREYSKLEKLFHRMKKTLKDLKHVFDPF